MVSPFLTVRWTPCNNANLLLIYKRAFSSESSFPTHLCQFILILLWARLYFKRNILWVLILWDSLKFAQVIFQTKQPMVLFEKMWKVQFEGARQVPPLNIDSGGGGGLGGQTRLWIILCSWWYHRLACFFIHLLCLCVWYIAIFYIDVVSSARGMRLESSCLLVQKSTICKWGKSKIWKWEKSTICKWINPPFANEKNPQFADEENPQFTN